MASIICTFLLGSCEEDENLGLESPAKQVDMTVLVPIHPSSLEFFDYVIHYYDNRGEECRDTIQSSYGTDVADNDNAISNNCYVKTYSYDYLFVTCTVNVELIPKKGGSTVGPFYFYIPKPYIFPNVTDSPATDVRANINATMAENELILIDEMDFELFKSTYGTTFSSHCGLYDDINVGYEIFFY